MDETNHDSLPGRDEIEHEPPPAADENGHESPPPTDDGDDKGVVILLVGNRDVDKSGVVKSLTKSGTWEDRRTAVDSSDNGVRILTCTSPARPARVVVDTTPLKNVKGRSPVAIARRWISRNCLRRILSGKNVVVVCVVTCRVRNTCPSDMFSYSNCWVDVFRLIFQDHKPAVMVLVNTLSTENVTQETKAAVARFVLDHGLSPQNITYSNWQRGDDSVSRVIEDGISQRQSAPDRRLHWIGLSSRKDSARVDLAKDGMKPPRWKSCWQPTEERPDTHHTHSTVMPFTINEALSEKYGTLPQKEKYRKYEALRDKEKFGPWGPERVILFGRTGSGKSTLAQMLTLGKLDKANETFDPSSGVRGGTKGVQSGIGRGWYVLDTPGFGESPNDAQSTIPTRQVEVNIKDYVRLVEGTFSHYIYVVKKDRLDQLEEVLWKFFTALFGEEIERQFTVVVSNADETWVRANLSELRHAFKGCDSFLSAEFPAIDEDDEAVETEYQDMRTESIADLEEKLATLNRCDMFCKYGRRARTNIRMETERADLDLGLERSERIKFLVRGASMIFACCNMSQRPLSELTQLLRVNDKISLIPA